VLAPVGDEGHGGGVVVGVEDGDAGVLQAESGQLRLERAVVERGQVVRPLEAATGVVRTWPGTPDCNRSGSSRARLWSWHLARSVPASKYRRGDYGQCYQRCACEKLDSVHDFGGMRGPEYGD
jgi:hypothetical protein